MIEINGNPNRRDLSDRHARLAAEAGVLICLNTDAHGIDTLDNMRYAVATARRAWLEPKNVANTRTWAQFSKLRKRTKAKTKAKKKKKAWPEGPRASGPPGAERPRSVPTR
jgi:DNA polymerase (family 10)